MKNVGTNVPAELLLGLALCPFFRAPRAHLCANSAAQSTSSPRNNFPLNFWLFNGQSLEDKLIVRF